MVQKSDQARAHEIAESFDWLDPELRADMDREYETYSLLQRSPRERSRKTNEWYFVGHEECREAFQKPELFSNDIYAVDNPHGITSTIPANTDGPEQREYRKMLDPLFNPRSMEKLEEDIRRFAIELMKPITAGEKTEFVEAFALPFPTIIFCRLMGFPVEDHPKIMRWIDIYMNSQSPYIAKRLHITEVDDIGRPLPEVARKLAEDAGAEISQYLSELLEQRRYLPKDDILSALLAARRPDGRPMNQDELTKICFNLFLGGLDTVTGMLAMIIRDFAQRPDRRSAFTELMDDPDRVGPAVEELIRFHSIVTIPRRVTAECEFRGLQLRQNDIVELMTTAACRDEARFVGADELDYSRSPNPHLAFGVGWHRCLGIHLARREVRIALQEIHRLMPTYSLDPADPPLVSTGFIHNMTTLPLRIGVASKY
jgi:cytochrome P450